VISGLGRDPDPREQYDRPMAVLASVFTASAAAWLWCWAWVLA
jgi:hypothetical protein